MDGIRLRRTLLFLRPADTCTDTGEKQNIPAEAQDCPQRRLIRTARRNRPTESLGKRQLMSTFGLMYTLNHAGSRKKKGNEQGQEQVLGNSKAEPRENRAAQDNSVQRGSCTEHRGYTAQTVEAVLEDS